MIRWQCSSYASLSCDELYAILALRQTVFVVEQHCPYLDADGADDCSWHLMGWEGEERDRQLVAYLRIVFPGVNYEEPSLGRVVTAPSVRGRGIGRKLTAQAIARAQELYPDTALRISAQHYLLAFYSEFGFAAVGDPYDEDGIPHIEMLRVA
ncbi:GNAT family N-acetyltransferase [Aestuariirhabdus sp. LZHN29]|uniref:GNAT family N-acetyltransferase n=1 Tax=Aestuariirhabdus sp. LZHN29 TaxID=3417462 RepID=UPI003CEB1F93